jgi:hypothetical protein
MTQAIVRYERPRNLAQEWIDEMFRTYLTRNAASAPEPDGSFYVGPIDDAPENLLLDRWGPYSICRGRRSETVKA